MKWLNRKNKKELSKDQAMTDQGRPNRSEMAGSESVLHNVADQDEAPEAIYIPRNRRKKNRFWWKFAVWALVIALIYLFFQTSFMFSISCERDSGYMEP